MALLQVIAFEFFNLILLQIVSEGVSSPPARAGLTKGGVPLFNLRLP
jgi:hypothetical protein